jgi:hypothetical protein
MIKDTRVIIVNSKGVMEYPYTITKGGKRIPYVSKLLKVNGKRECARRIRQFLRSAAKGHKHG